MNFAKPNKQSHAFLLAAANIQRIYTSHTTYFVSFLFFLYRKFKTLEIRGLGLGK